MKSILVFLLMVLMATTAFAGPWLVCDPDTACETYNVYADGVIMQAGVSAPLAYDLVTSPLGGIAYTAECCNVEGCSAQSDPYISLGIPGVPSNLRMSLQP